MTKLRGIVASLRQSVWIRIRENAEKDEVLAELEVVREFIAEHWDTMQRQRRRIEFVVPPLDCFMDEVPWQKKQ